MPPFRATYLVRLEGNQLGSLQSPWISVGGESNARQGRLDPTEEAFFAERGYRSEGYTLLNLGAGVTLPLGRQEVRLDLTLRNALDKKYANFLSRYKTYALDPGRNLTVRLSTGF
jgi:hypothetical protein